MTAARQLKQLSKRLPYAASAFASLLAIAGPTADAQEPNAGQARPSFRDDRRWVPKSTDAGPAPAALPAPASAAPSKAPEQPRSPPSPAVPVSLQPTKSGCPAATLKSTALEAGRMHVALTSSCRAEQEITWGYGGAELAAKFDKSGHAEFIVDCFVGTTSPVVVKFQDNTSIEAPVQALDLDKVSKIALLWNAPVNLDLHVFEYAALAGSPGHVSANTPRSAVLARESTENTGRGHGFMSTITPLSASRDHLEVFTFLHRDTQSWGALTLAIDNETRGSKPGDDHCGTGSLAEVPFKIVQWSRRGQVTRDSGLIAAVPCGTPIAIEDRLTPLGNFIIKARW